MKNIKETLLQIMSAALKASKPDGNFKHIPSKPEGKTIILGAGKASASMIGGIGDALGGVFSSDGKP